MKERLFVYGEFKDILLKTTGLGDHLRWRMEKKEDVLFAFVHGDFAEDLIDENSRLEVFLVGRLPPKLLAQGLDYARTLHLRPAAGHQMSEKKFREEVRRKNPDLLRLLAGPKVFVVGDQRDLKTLLNRAGPPSLLSSR
jgi:hypothetical protein